jgi:hypothetical protein
MHLFCAEGVEQGEASPESDEELELSLHVARSGRDVDGAARRDRGREDRSPDCSCICITARRATLTR